MIRLDATAIDHALPLVASGLEKYWHLQQVLATTDVTRDPDFQTAFNAFYRVRRGGIWRTAFYALLQQEKTSPRAFAAVLRALHTATGRIEASFASKLAATADPFKPVIDSFVLKNLGLRLPSRGTAELRLAGVEGLYDHLGQAYAAFLGTETGQYLVRRFVEMYARRPVTPVKMLDLVLWQTR